MGNPQPLNILEQKIPSFEPSISKAIKIQRVTLLPCVQQQFIKTSCVDRRGYVIAYKAPAVFFLSIT